MREWLKSDYGSLAALNRQWGTAFDSWDEVVPMTTDEAMQALRREFFGVGGFQGMDGRRLCARPQERHRRGPCRRSQRACRRSRAPRSPAGAATIILAWQPASTRWSCTIMAKISRSRARSIPELIMLTTSFRSGPAEAHRVWRELLRGTRGLILWDDKSEFVGKDGSLRRQGTRSRALFRRDTKRPRRPVDQQPAAHGPGRHPLFAGEPAHAMAARPKSVGRGMEPPQASTEYRGRRDQSEHAAVRPCARAYGPATPVCFIRTSAARRAPQADYRVLILPHAIALAPSEAAEIRGFVERGGVVIADSEPGQFDEHGRTASRNPLCRISLLVRPDRSAASFAFGKGKAIYLASANGRDRQNSQRLSRILDSAGVRPPFPVLRIDGQPANDVETLFSAMES